MSEVRRAKSGCVAVFATPDPEAGTERLVVAAEVGEHDVAARERVRAAIVSVTVDMLGTPPDEVLLLRTEQRAQDVERKDPTRCVRRDVRAAEGSRARRILVSRSRA